jgi:general secretion pathway protein A
MYQKFFGLRESPFNVNPDPRYLFLTKQIQEALAGLTYGIQNRKGFILLTGEVGTGKTTLLNRLLDWLHGQRVATAFVFNSQVNVSQLFDFMMADFEIPCETRHKSQVLLKLNAWLLDRYRAGETAVLIVDEAQNLSLQVLEEIRLLTNLETSTEKTASDCADRSAGTGREVEVAAIAAASAAYYVEVSDRSIKPGGDLWVHR